MTAPNDKAETVEPSPFAIWRAAATRNTLVVTNEYHYAGCPPTCRNCESAFNAGAEHAGAELQRLRALVEDVRKAVADSHDHAEGQWHLAMTKLRNAIRDRLAKFDRGE